jgi:hypothetical protein
MSNTTNTLVDVEEPAYAGLLDICRAAVSLRTDAILSFETHQLEVIGQSAVQLIEDFKRLPLVSPHLDSTRDHLSDRPEKEREAKNESHGGTLCLPDLRYS